MELQGYHGDRLRRTTDAFWLFGWNRCIGLRGLLGATLRTFRELVRRLGRVTRHFASQCNGHGFKSNWRKPLFFRNFVRPHQSQVNSFNLTTINCRSREITKETVLEICSPNILHWFLACEGCKRHYCVFFSFLSCWRICWRLTVINILKRVMRMLN